MRTNRLLSLSALLLLAGAVQGCGESVDGPGEEPKSWRAPVLLEMDDAAEAYGPDLAADSQGNAVVVWAQRSAGAGAVWASRFVPGRGWDPRSRVNTGDSPGDPQVAALSSGAVAVYQEYDGRVSSIASSQLTGASGWSAQTIIETNAVYADVPAIAGNGSDTAVAAWRHFGDGRSGIWANVYRTGTGWGTAVLIGQSIVSGQPQVAVDLAGNAIIVWDIGEGIVANRYTSAAGWGTTTRINTGTAFAYDPQVAVDASGNALAVWRQEKSICANRYTAARGWGAPVTLDTSESVSLPHVAVDRSGNAIAVWAGLTAAEAASGVRSSRYTLAASWDRPAKLSQTVAGERGIDGPRIALGPTGAGVAVWEQDPGGELRRDVRAAQFDPGTGWSEPSSITAGNQFFAGLPAVTIDAEGNATAVWIQNAGTDTPFSLWANRFE